MSPVLSFFRRLFVAPSDPVVRLDAHASAAGEHVDECAVLALSSAYACTRLLSGSVGSLPIEIKQEDSSGNKATVLQHPLSRILRRAPNAEQTAVDFWEGAIASLELKGNILARKLRGAGGQIVGVEPIPWDHVSVQRERDDGRIVYQYKGDKLYSDDVLHIRGFGGSPLGGISTIAIGAEVFGLAKAVNKASGAVFKNGARPSGAVQTDLKLDPEQRKQLEDRLLEKYQGAMNTGRPLVLDFGLKWQALSLNPDDAQMLESRAFSVEEVCRIFGVPPFMIGHTEKSTSWGTGIEQQTLGFQKFTLRPRVRRIEQALERQLLSAEDIANGLSIEFNFEGLLRADSNGRGTYYRTMTQIGAMTINEVRKREGLPPIDGGDVARLQAQNVPITDPPAEGQAVNPPAA